MVTNPYLKWLSETAGYWWTDSAEYATMDEAIANGATGVTTNPILVKKSLYAFPDFWRPYLKSAEGLSGDAKAEEIIRFGASQRTLSQFVEAGWSMIAEFPL